MNSSAHLGKNAARSVAITVVGQGAIVLAQFASLVVLARLVGPADFGLVAMATAVIGIGEVLRDFGLSTAAIQAPSMSRDERNNLFWMNTLIGGVLTMSVLGGAGTIASVFGQPSLENIVRILSVTFLLNGMATQYRASLARDIKTRQLMTVDVTGQVTGLVVGFVIAIGGGGYWALVALNVSRVFAYLVVAVTLCRWLPGLPARHVDMRRFTRFGLHLLGSQLVVYLSKNVDSIVIGRNLGAEALGFYNRAFQLLLFPLSQINAPSSKLAVPVLARLRAEPERYDQFLLVGQKALVQVVVLIFMFAMAFAEPIIGIVLGSDWSPVVPVFQILCVAGIFEAAHYASSWIFLSKGLSQSLLRYTVIARPILILLVVGASFHSTLMVAAVYSGWTVAVWPFALWWISRSERVPVRAMISNTLRLIVASLFSVIVGVGVASVVTEVAVLWKIGMGAIGTAIGLLGCTLAWPAYREDLEDFIRMVKLAAPKRSVSK